jgi:hypothetical protein
VPSLSERVGCFCHPRRRTWTASFWDIPEASRIVYLDSASYNRNVRTETSTSTRLIPNCTICLQAYAVATRRSLSYSRLLASIPCHLEAFGSTSSILSGRWRLSGKSFCRKPRPLKHSFQVFSHTRHWFRHLGARILVKRRLRGHTTLNSRFEGF